MLFFNVFIIGAIIAFVFTISLLNSSVRGRCVIDGVEGKIESMLRAVQIAAANNRAEVERNLGSPKQVFDALEREIRVNNKFIGCFAAFEPDYFKDQGRWFEAYVYYTDSTRLESRQIGSPSHDYFNGVWYEKGLSLNKDDLGYLTSPYFDNSVDSSMYCSYVLPIVDGKGRKVGVYGVDLKYLWIYSVIADIENNVKDEFYIEDDEVKNEDGDILFSVQVVDDKGNRILGSDSIDVSILKAEQDDVIGKLGMKDLKGTPYYATYKKLNYTDWTLVFLQHRDLVFMWGGVLAFFILFFMIVGGIVIFIFMSRSIKHATKPLAFLSQSAQEVAKGNFDTPLPTFRHNDEITQMRDSFDTMQQSLKQYVAELKESTAMKASMESELNVAHSIQMSMLPKMFPPFPQCEEIDLYAMLSPAKAVGGDLYDYFIHNGKLFFCIGDVSGKGVPASLVMAVSRTLFRNIAMHVDKPSHIIETMNANISDGNEECMFVTMFVGVLDLQTGHLSYCNAGHNAPYMIGKEVTMISNHQPNFPVGALPDVTFTEQETTLSPDTTIFMYTDGLTEAENARQEQFGEQRAIDVISTLTDASPQQMIETMTNAVRQFVGNTEQSDDLTMLAIKYVNKLSKSTNHQ